MTVAVPPAAVALPRYSGGDVGAYLNQLVLTLEQRLAALAAPGGGGNWTTSNVTASRTLDPTTATLSSLAENVATVILDLQSKGVLGV